MFYFDGVKGKKILPSYSNVSFIAQMGASAVNIPISKLGHVSSLLDVRKEGQVITAAVANPHERTF